MSGLTLVDHLHADALEPDWPEDLADLVRKFLHGLDTELLHDAADYLAVEECPNGAEEPTWRALVGVGPVVEVGYVSNVGSLGVGHYFQRAPFISIWPCEQAKARDHVWDAVENVDYDSTRREPWRGRELIDARLEVRRELMHDRCQPLHATHVPERHAPIMAVVRS